MTAGNAARGSGRAMVPGTFDPITVGHIDVIKRASKLFKEVIVAVAESPRKGNGPIFTLERRAELASEALKDIPNVSVVPFKGLLVDFAAEHDVQVVVKGLRAVTDFESEFQMSALNYKLDPGLETIFIMSVPENMYLSSSVVREIAYFKGNVKGLVPEVVGKALAELTGCSYK
ncbi:MAG: pantetheine-phosphate adenylyltransferase [Coriobacteriales bacterium]|jgi:pantetheine-phosphate adenylyltransferase